MLRKLSEIRQDLDLLKSRLCREFNKDVHPEDRHTVSYRVNLEKYLESNRQYKELLFELEETKEELKFSREIAQLSDGMSLHIR